MSEQDNLDSLSPETEQLLREARELDAKIRLRLLMLLEHEAISQSFKCNSHVQDFGSCGFTR